MRASYLFFVAFELRPSRFCGIRWFTMHAMNCRLLVLRYSILIVMIIILVIIVIINYTI